MATLAEIKERRKPWQEFYFCKNFDMCGNFSNITFLAIKASDFGKFVYFL